MKLKVVVFVTIVLTAVFLIPSQAAYAQNVYAAIHGTVTDTSGAVVPGATVTAVNTSTGISYKQTTDGKGYYVLPQMAIGGPYTVTIDKTGFQNSKTVGLTLQVNDNREVNAALQPGSVSQTVEVQAAAVQVETSDTQLKQVITAQQIEEAPLLDRDASGLQKLEAGTMESSDRFGTYSSNGNQTQDNSYVLNGADINDGPLQDEGIAINPDALAEENFVTSTLNPEVSRNSGEEINQVIKSGTNTFHGDAFEFYRDTFLNNGNYFSLPGQRPVFHQNLYGGTLGGPVLKNHLFFFLAYQGLRNSTATTQLSPVFNPDQLMGDFSGDNNIANTGPNNQVGLSSNPIPFAINGCAAGTAWNQCFPNGTVQVSPSAWNPIAAKLLQEFMPAANTTVSGGSYYNFNAGSTAAQDQGVIRLDYHPSQNDSLWGSSVFASNPSTSELGFGGSDLPGFGTVQAEHFKLFMASWTHTFNPTTLNELRAGYFRFNFAAVEPAEVVQPSTYGFNITPQSPQANLPAISVTGLNGTSAFLGFTFEGPQPRKDTNLNGADNFMKIVGNHSLKLGVYYEQFQVANPYYADNNGSYSFAGGGTYSSGDPILDYVMGIPDGYAQTSGGLVDAISHEYYVYAQDSWRASNDLTLNYGIVWDAETPSSNHQFNGTGITCWSPGNQTSSVFPGGPPGLTYPSDPGCNLAGGPTTKWNHFGPRIGFAWSPSNGPSMLVGEQGSHSFALRGGFGMYWNRDAEEGQLQNLSDPPGIFSSPGALIAGGSPSFADPFEDVTGDGTVSTTNPFPYTPPAPGTQLDWNNFAGLDMSAYPNDYTVPYAYNFNVNIQRSLPSNMVLQIGYVGSLGRKLVRDYEADKITAAGHAACLADPVCTADRANLHLDYPQYFTQPAVASNGVPWYLSVGQQATDGASNYNSLQVSLQKGPTHGLYFSMAYTYSHALDNGSGLESSGFNGLGVNTFPGYQYLSYGDSDYDARQRLALLYNYEIPIFASWKDNVFAREAVGGWHLSGVTALQTGFPVTILNEGAFTSLYCDRFSYYSCPDNPNTSTYNIQTLNPRNGGLWFNPSDFSQATVGTFGNVKRNFFHGPGFNYTDLSIYKHFPLGGEQRSIELRMDAFNAFNHANFSPPDSNFTDGPGFFGTVTSVIGTSTADVNGDPQPGRAVQLSGKFYF